MLQRNGYSLKTSSSGNQVNASLKVSEVKMNVPQFERYKFSLTLVSKEGRLEWESLIAGKNLGSITEMAKNEFAEYLSKNIDKLKID